VLKFTIVGCALVADRIVCEAPSFPLGVQLELGAMLKNADQYTCNTFCIRVQWLNGDISRKSPFFCQIVAITRYAESPFRQLRLAGIQHLY
jgi:hypothetical protein